MRKNIKSLPLFLAALFVITPIVSFAQSADNTKLNERDSDPAELTAEEQGETPQDRDITQKIRKAIVGDDTLSNYAHNIKIITSGGVVTLKGPVVSEEEKDVIGQLASDVAGNTNVHNEIGIVGE